MGEEDGVVEEGGGRGNRGAVGNGNDFGSSGMDFMGDCEHVFHVLIIKDDNKDEGSLEEREINK